jgi:hypothetical protein
VAKRKKKKPYKAPQRFNAELSKGGFPGLGAKPERSQVDHSYTPPKVTDPNRPRESWED